MAKSPHLPSDPLQGRQGYALVSVPHRHGEVLRKSGVEYSLLYHEPTMEIRQVVDAITNMLAEKRTVRITSPEELRTVDKPALLRRSGQLSGKAVYLPQRLGVTIGFHSAMQGFQSQPDAPADEAGLRKAVREDGIIYCWGMALDGPSSDLRRLIRHCESGHAWFHVYLGGQGQGRLMETEWTAMLGTIMSPLACEKILAEFAKLADAISEVAREGGRQGIPATGEGEEAARAESPPGEPATPHPDATPRPSAEQPADPEAPSKRLVANRRHQRGNVDTRWEQVDPHAILADVERIFFSVQTYDGVPPEVVPARAPGGPATARRAREGTALRPADQPPGQAPGQAPGQPAVRPRNELGGTVAFMTRHDFQRTIQPMRWAARWVRKIEGRPTGHKLPDITRLTVERFADVPGLVLQARAVDIVFPAEGDAPPKVLTAFPSHWLEKLADIDAAADFATPNDPIFRQRPKGPEPEPGQDK